MSETPEKQLDVTVIESNAVDRKVVSELVKGAERFGVALNVSAFDPNQAEERKNSACDLLILPYELMQSLNLSQSSNTVVAIISKRAHPELPNNDTRVDGFIYKEDLNPLSILPWCHLANERSSK